MEFGGGQQERSAVTPLRQEVLENLNALLEAVCDKNSFVLAEALCPRDDGNCLIQSSAFHCKNKELEGFQRASQEFVFPLQIGIPGRVWKNRKLSWHGNVSSLPSTIFLRAELAKQSSLRGCVAIPLQEVDSDNFFVIIFYSHHELASPAAANHVLDTVGQCLERLSSPAAAFTIPPPAPAAASGKYAVGAKVEARYRGKKKWYAGEVTKVDGDTYSITYEDGDVEDGVAEELIRAVEEAAPAPAPASAAEEATSDGFEAGMQVEARYKGKKKWYKGTVMKRNDDGSYEIMYDDGDKESGVSADFVKAPEESGKGAKTQRRQVAAPAPAPAADTKVFETGTKIEALYKGKKNWYAGVVDRYDEDAGTYDVTYDDGEVEKGVKQENIARAPGDSELEVGARIEAKYKGKKKYYPGKIAARSGDTYDIDYDDGEKESGVARNLIREA